MTYPDGIDALVNVNANDSLAAGGHAARHNSVNTALVEVKDYLVGALGSKLDTTTAASTYLPIAGGKILQTISTTKTDSFSASVASAAETAITGLSLAITPSSNLNKIFIIYQVYGALDLSGGASGTNGILTILKRDSTSIGIGDTAGNRRRITAGPQGSIAGVAMMIGSGGFFLDSPSSASSLTYSVSIGHTSGATQIVYVNRTGTDSDSTLYYRTISTLTAIEVSA
jgi:hypothetical protein